jgi:D-aminopeptidase
MVTATRTAILTHNGVPITVRDGDEYANDDPIVAAFPWMFTEPVEQATAAPGEKRAVRRKR